MAKPIFYFKDEAAKHKLRRTITEIPLQIGNVINKMSLSKEEIETELELCNKAQDKIQEYKEMLYNNLIFYI